MHRNCVFPIWRRTTWRVLYDDGTFMIVGRADNVVNSGGVKIQIEEEEHRLKELISVPFALTSVPDRQLGEALVLLLVRDFPMDDADLFSAMKLFCLVTMFPGIFCAWRPYRWREMVR